MGLNVAFISVDGVEGAAKTATAYKVPFPLLSDPDQKAHQAFRVVNKLDDAGVKRLKGMGLDVERWSNRKHHTIAIPAVFLIGKDRKVKWAHADKDYRTRPDFDALLTALAKAK